MNIIKKVLMSGNFFANKDLPLLEQLATFLFVKKVKKKEILLREGSINNKIYYVQKGLLRVYVIHEGKEINTWFVKEGEFINSVTSFYYQTPSDEYIEAIEDCEVLEIKKSTYEWMLKNNLKLALFVIDQLYINLCEYHDQCQSLRFMNAEKKYEFLLNKKPDILNRLSQKHIASFLGIETTYLSKIISKL
ncbi:MULTISPECIES: Crp/Fnr family transcriptional regulator [Flavobacterium]|uniref:Crp/Fnr family transcriptional regulator n=1 Tax=Flavobacterium keumense TaxID=1306518 RepID=A0ABY8N614_9FLAO|nr:MULTISPECIES: Crp/Fnr family transcriptional regulator [Flavobacterium]WGK95085.1 Crp/Fnr family transcriptional regulator [Flavobacterium keumense]